MYIRTKIKPATLEEAFEVEPLKSTNIIGKDSIELELRTVSRKSIDVFLDDSENFENAEIFYPSKMNIPDQSESEPSTINNKPESLNVVRASFISSSKVDSKSTITLSEREDNQPSPFILANTEEVTLQHLKHECIIPVFSKDNEKTIAHQEFIEIVLNAVNKVFPHHSISTPEIRVSHQIKGRIPEAIHKNVKDLLDHEKTIYYMRMAFIIKIPSITDNINGNELSLTIGGVRAYNQENLYNKKTFEKFKFFVGFQNKVCCNLCVWSDGFVEDLKVSSYEELQCKLFQVLNNYNAEKHLLEMKQFADYSLTEHQFAQLLGRTRLYQHLPKREKQNLPLLHFTDGHINTITKDYYEDENFCRDNAGDINLWNLYNLFTQANKSSYIDTFLDRNLNAFEFSKGIQKTLNGSSDYNWFLS